MPAVGRPQSEVEIEDLQPDDDMSDDDDPAYTAETRVGANAYLQIAQLMTEVEGVAPPNADPVPASTTGQITGVEPRHKSGVRAKQNDGQGGNAQAASEPREDDDGDGEDEALETTQLIGEARIPTDLRAEIQRSLSAAIISPPHLEHVVHLESDALIPVAGVGAAVHGYNETQRYVPPKRVVEAQAQAAQAQAAQSQSQAPRSQGVAQVSRPPAGFTASRYPAAQPINPPTKAFTPTQLPAGLRPRRVSASEVLVFFIAFLLVLVPSLIVLDRML